MTSQIVFRASRRVSLLVEVKSVWHFRRRSITVDSPSFSSVTKNSDNILLLSSRVQLKCDYWIWKTLGDSSCLEIFVTWSWTLLVLWNHIEVCYVLELPLTKLVLIVRCSMLMYSILNLDCLLRLDQLTLKYVSHYDHK